MYLELRYKFIYLDLNFKKLICFITSFYLTLFPQANISKKSYFFVKKKPL